MRMRRKPVLLAVLMFVGGQSLLFGRPEFFARFAADPFSKPEWRTAMCATCHINPKGGGPRNEFGRAFARNGFMVTPELRLNWPDRFVPSLSAETRVDGTALKAIWAAGRDDAVLVEINGEQFLVNRVLTTVEKVEAPQVQAYLTEGQPPSATSAAPMVPTELLETPPTLDYYLVNMPTNRVRSPRSLHLRFTHRFSDPVASGTGRLRNLFGFDSFSLSSFGVEVGLLKRVSFVTYRSPYAHVTGGPTIEMGPVFHILQQGERVPLSLSFRATVEGEHNFTERFTTNLVPVLSRSFKDVLEVFLVPTFNLAVPRRTLTADFPLVPGERRNHLITIGLGGSWRIRPRTALVAEWQPRVSGFRGLNSRNTYSFGVQRSTGRHVFGLTFSNSQSTTTTRSLTDAQSTGFDATRGFFDRLDDFRIGFNLYRRIW